MAASTFSIPWSQGDASDTLQVEATTKASELKLLLGAEACAANMQDGVTVAVKKGPGVFMALLDKIVQKDGNAGVKVVAFSLSAVLLAHRPHVKWRYTRL